MARIPSGVAGGLTEHERRSLTCRRRGRLSEQTVAEVARTGTPAEIAAAGRVLLSGGRPVEQVARQWGVAVDTARPWARTTATAQPLDQVADEAGGAA